MSFTYFTKEKIITSEEKLSKKKINGLFNGVVIVRKTWWGYRYGKRHSSKGGCYLKYKLPKSKIINIIKV
ncbi:MAG: hypothetical protein HYS62_03070 [Candidatus Aenigmarchaeota archaeon]|nr:hypothetical protein [Candidatus Aenigmarchaeota archaeon]